jgi:hypothetical protein
MLKKLQIIIAVFLLCTLNTKSQVIYSVQAHQDDWQLFMSSRIVTDLTSGASKVVFITLTAGDQGCPGCNYYMDRERGAVYSSKFLGDQTLGGTPLDMPTAQNVTVNGKSLVKYTYRNTVNYFFRLPDGNTNGAGYPTTGSQSLQRLNTGAISTISVLNHTSAELSYTFTWASLVATIQAIINSEKITGQQAWLHSTSLNTGYNPGDHSDHRYSAIAAQAAVPTPTYAWVGITGFMNYASSVQPANLTSTQHENAAIFFGLEAWAISEGEYANEFNSIHQPWMAMDYYEVVRTPSGTAFTGRPMAGDQNQEFTKIPMLVTFSNTVAIDKQISFIISPYQTGEITATVVDEAGKRVMEKQIVKINKKEPVLITLPGVLKAKGNYELNLLLNNKYSESIKLIVD